MNKKTGKVIAITAAFLINLGIYIALLWSSTLIMIKVQNGEPNHLLGLLMGFVVYAVFLKIKPFRVTEMIKRYSEELSRESSKDIK